MNHPSPQRLDPQSASQRTAGFRSETILHICSNQENRRLHRQVLERPGYAVRIANDDGEDWDLVQRRHFDLMVTDNDTPRMSGLEVAGKIRSNKRGY